MNENIEEDFGFEGISILAVINRAVACYKQGYLKKARDLLFSVYTDHEANFLLAEEVRKSLYLLINWSLQADAIQQACQCLEELSNFEEEQFHVAENYRPEHSIILKFYKIIYMMKTAGDGGGHMQLRAELMQELDGVDMILRERVLRGARRVFDSISYYLRAEIFMLIFSDFNTALDCYEEARSLLRVGNQGIRLPGPAIPELDCLFDEIADPEVLRHKVELRRLQAREKLDGFFNYNEADSGYSDLINGGRIVKETEAYLEASLSHAMLKLNAAQHSKARGIADNLVSFIGTSQAFKDRPPGVILMIKIHYIRALSLEAGNRLADADTEYETCARYLFKAFEDTILSTGLGLAVVVARSRLLQSLGRYAEAREGLSVLDNADMEDYPFPAILALAQLELTKINIQMQRTADLAELNMRLKVHLDDLDKPFIRKSHLAQGAVVVGLFNLSRKNVLSSIAFFKMAIENINSKNNLEYALSIYLYSLVTFAYSLLFDKLVNKVPITFKGGGAVEHNIKEIEGFVGRVGKVDEEVVFPFTLAYYADIQVFDQRILRVFQHQIEACVKTNQLEVAEKKIQEIGAKIAGRVINAKGAVTLNVNAWVGYLKLQIIAKLDLKKAKELSFYQEIARLIVNCYRAYRGDQGGSWHLLLDMQDVLRFFKENEKHLRSCCRDTGAHHRHDLGNGLLGGSEDCIDKFIYEYNNLAERGSVAKKESITREEYTLIQKELEVDENIAERLARPYDYKAEIEEEGSESKAVEVGYYQPVLSAEERRAVLNGTMVRPQTYKVCENDRKASLDWQGENVQRQSYPYPYPEEINLADPVYREKVLTGEEIVEKRLLASLVVKIVDEKVPWDLLSTAEKFTSTICLKPPMRSKISREVFEKTLILRAVPTRRFPAYDPCYLESGVTTVPIFPDDELRVEPRVGVLARPAWRPALRRRGSFNTLGRGGNGANNIMQHFSARDRGRTLFEAVHEHLQVKFEGGARGLERYVQTCLNNHVGTDLMSFLENNELPALAIDELRALFEANDFTNHRDIQLLALSFALRRLVIVIDGDPGAEVSLPREFSASVLDLVGQDNYARRFTASPIYMELNDNDELVLLHVVENQSADEINALPSRLYNNLMRFRRDEQARELHGEEELDSEDGGYIPLWPGESEGSSSGSSETSSSEESGDEGGGDVPVRPGEGAPVYAVPEPRGEGAEAPPFDRDNGEAAAGLGFGGGAVLFPPVDGQDDLHAPNLVNTLPPIR